MGPSGRGCSTSPHPSYHSEWKNVNTVTECNQTSLILYDTSVVLWWCCQWVKFNPELEIKPINPLSPALYKLKVDMDKKISLKMMGVKTKYLNLTCVRVTIIQVLCVNLMLCRIKTHHRMNFLLKTSIQKRGFALFTLICDDKLLSHWPARREQVWSRRLVCFGETKSERPIRGQAAHRHFKAPCLVCTHT